MDGLVKAAHIAFRGKGNDGPFYFELNGSVSVEPKIVSDDLGDDDLTSLTDLALKFHTISMNFCEWKRNLLALILSVLIYF